MSTELRFKIHKFVIIPIASYYRGDKLVIEKKLEPVCILSSIGISFSEVADKIEKSYEAKKAEVGRHPKDKGNSKKPQLPIGRKIRSSSSSR